MILLLGATGYVGSAFARELQRRNLEFLPISRKQVDYTSYPALLSLFRSTAPSFLINCAGFIGRPNVDACESQKAETLLGNSVFPQMLAVVCAEANLSWGHISSGCIYKGAIVIQDSKWSIEPDLTRPDLKTLFNEHTASFNGFAETNAPNFSFRNPPCSFYSGSKALAEEAIERIGRNYIRRLRLPFDEIDGPRNFLSKIQRYPRVYDNVNSMSHISDCVRACVDLWQRHAKFGIYNVTNPGAVTTRDVIAMIERILKPDREFEFWKDDVEFYGLMAKTPRSNCILDVSKLLEAGVPIRPVHDALEHALQNWQPEIR